MTSSPAWFERLAGIVPTLTGSPFSPLRAPADGSARQSAVLILFGPSSADSPSSAGSPSSADSSSSSSFSSSSGSSSSLGSPGSSGADLLLTERSTRLRSHPGQVAFPGGRIDPEDAGPEAAAVREAVEETGLDPAGVRVAAVGPDLYVPVTNFLVTPVLAWWERPSPVAPGDDAEVARVIRVPVDELLAPRNRFQTVHPSGFVSPGFEVDDLLVWGFTGGVLDWLLSLSGLEQPWDRELTREVPERFLTDRNTQRGLSRELAAQLDERVGE